MKKKYALLSVYDKTGIVEFAQALIDLGYTILASGGTARKLKEAGLEVTDSSWMVTLLTRQALKKANMSDEEIELLLDGDAILDHRVVTLSREVHAALLARAIKDDMEEMEKRGIPYIDLVRVDMYPLEAEIAKEGSTIESVIEQTDIGGPTMLRSGAKGRRIIVSRASDCKRVIQWLHDGKPDEGVFIKQLCAQAEYDVAMYVGKSAMYHGEGRFFVVGGEKAADCAYGENRLQTPAAIYSTGGNDPLAITAFQLATGTPMSYNNACDLDRLLQIATHMAKGFDTNVGKVPLLAIAVKHGNACGAAGCFVPSSQEEVIKRMIMGDPIAIHGGLVLVNFALDEDLAEMLLAYGMRGGRRLLDGIIAPSITPTAIEMFRRKGDKCRILINPALTEMSASSMDIAPRPRHIRGGLLLQPNYTYTTDLNDPEMKAIKPLKEMEKRAILFGTAICSCSTSNTITLVKVTRVNNIGAVIHLIGNGVGQQARVHGAELAIANARRAKHPIKGAIAISDSFFIATDAPGVLIKHGVKTIYTTRGSVNDDKVLAFCRKKEINLVTIPDGIGRGFFGH